MSITTLSRASLPVAVSAIAALVCCVSPSGSNGDSRAVACEGMVSIGARGATIVLGSDGASAKSDEKPPMRVSFSCSFCIDSTEVTVGAYEQIMGRLPAQYDSIAYDSAWPVAHVSWYDALVFCNRRSKAASLDTVYTYSRIDSLPGGMVFRLCDLDCRWEVDGIRLPTEAEWQYAASCGDAREYVWGPQDSRDSARLYCWFADNAATAPRPVGTLRASGWKLFDMGGNVMEWVFDGKASFRDLTVDDYVGAAAFAQAERVVKGGGFVHGIEFLRLSARSDAYPTTAATSARYIGFRCARGPIEKPVMLSESGITSRLNPVRPAPVDMRAAAGTAAAKLVFVNRTGQDIRTLCYIDYSEAAPQVHEFADMTNVFLPAISPDGRWVAFSTAGIGGVDNSRIHVRRLAAGSDTVGLSDAPAFAPRWWIDAATHDTAVVYTSSTIDNNNPAWTSSVTKQQFFSQGRFSGSPIVLEEHGSYHGGVSAGGEYCATGYTRLKMKNRAGGEVRTLFTYPNNGKPGEDTAQVCNVSISPDAVHTDEVLFVDFGCGTRPSELTGTTYGLHEIIFKGSFSGPVGRWYCCPDRYAGWDHPRWSNRYDFAAAGVQSADGMHPAIYVIDLADSTYFEAVSGTNLWHPDLWISPAATIAGVDLDSAGRYGEPPLTYAQELLACKMRIFWRKASDLQVVFVGSSRVADGIDPRCFTGFSSYNLAYGGGDQPAAEVLIRDYVLKHCPQIECIGISLNLDWLNLPGANYSWRQGTALSIGYTYDKNHDFWSTGLPNGFVDAVLTRPLLAADTVCGYIDSLGLFPYVCEGWGGTPEIIGSFDWTVASADFISNYSRFADLARECAARGVHFLIVNFPRSPKYNETEAYSKWGPKHETAHEILGMVRQMADEDAFIHYYDAHRDGAHDYGDADAYDEDHLCETGARKLSTRIDSVLHSILD